MEKELKLNKTSLEQERHYTGPVGGDLGSWNANNKNDFERSC